MRTPFKEKHAAFSVFSGILDTGSVGPFGGFHPQNTCYIMLFWIPSTPLDANDSVSRVAARHRGQHRGQVQCWAPFTTPGAVRRTFSIGTLMLGLNS